MQDNGLIISLFLAAFFCDQDEGVFFLCIFPIAATKISYYLYGRLEV
jgi:hypothetical protein